ncbi:hypothetical protein EP7_001372 [Isosphaeraceae bacterium EP7]
MKETIMSELGKHKLTDALPQKPHENDEDKGGQPHPTHDTVAEQAREQQKLEEAKNAEASIRDRMVDIGRGNQQSGRQGQ